MKIMNYLSLGFAYIKPWRWYITAVLVFSLGLYYYFYIYSAGDDTQATFYVVNSVEKGEVTSGIETTGEIVAEQKLDLDIYKLQSRIDAVNVQNGSQVEKGDVLVAFDKSDAAAAAGSAKADMAEAELSYSEAKTTYSDQNTAIASKEREIAGYEEDIVEARRTFYSANLTAVAHPDNEDDDEMKIATPPTISGTYYGTATGSYYVKLYRDSLSTTGWTFYAVLGSDRTSPRDAKFGIAMDVGASGLKAMWSTAPSGSQTWSVAVPNTNSPAYQDNKKAYENSVSQLNVKLATAKQDLEELKRTDSSSYRDLNVEKAAADFTEARQKLSQQYTVLKEREIIAPFSGSIDGMENVVIGATPTGGESDPIILGTLVSDTFLATFTLGASDVSAIKVGDRVKVSVTSFANQPIFDASITEISSLPSGSGVAQYTVKARLEYDKKTASTILREGMLADIEIVQQEKADSLRLPASAILYENGQAYVTMVDSLTEEQTQEIEQFGIIRTEGDTLATYKRAVKLGIVGKYYVEVIEGVSEGERVLTASVSETATAAVVNQGFGGGGGGPPQGGSDGQSAPAGGSTAPSQ